MVATILLPILSGSVVLVQRRSDDDVTNFNYDYDNSAELTNDNIDLAGGYYDSSNQEAEQTNNYYDPYYGYNTDNSYNGYYNNYNYDTTNQAEGRTGLTFGEPSFYFGNWVDTAGSMINRAAKSIQE